LTRAAALSLILVLLGAFALVNWDAFTTASTLSVGVASFQAPLGLILLGLFAFMAVLFTVWAIAMQASALREARRQTRELQAQRDLADRAEASRFTELRAELLARLDRMEADGRTALEQTGNSLAAQLGELQDRLERDRPPPAR
jgi:uncharacterized integral membrane protein